MPIHRKHIDIISPLLARLEQEDLEKGEDEVEKEKAKAREKFPELVTDTMQTAFERREEVRKAKRDEKKSRDDLCPLLPSPCVRAKG